MLALARSMTKDTPRRSVRFVAFVNEESPYFGTESMGSLIYARRCRAQQENVVAMLSLETLGFYSDADESQKYPLPLALIYPSKGNFIGFIGNVESVELVKQTVTAFRQSVLFPAEGAALPDAIDGVGWSDHWAFWQQGYPALMVTDTAMFRNPHYHQATDKPPTLSYDRLARVVSGLAGAVRSLASAERPADTPR
jgi:Zn-dependent M28 family amino/carboxypeptidase